MDASKLVLIILVQAVIAGCLHQAVAREYCQFESFNVSCSVNQIILMEEARYGRLQLGRCVTRDYGFLGCSTDVLDLLDRSCSGVRSCQFSVPTLRDLVQPCPKDLTSYLEASYRCVTVLDHSSLRCNSTVLLSNAASLTHVIYSSPPLPHSPQNQVQSKTDGDSVSSQFFLSSSCPSFFQANPGQRIQVTLYSFGHYVDFSPSFGTESTSESDQQKKAVSSCPLNVFIVEDGKKEVVYPVCQVRQREQQLQTTNGTSASVYFAGDLDRKQLDRATNRKVNHILKLEATGCPDLKAPQHAWIERFDDRLVVRCNHTHETWYLTCKGTVWVGSVTNCTQASLHANGQITSSRKKSIPFGLVIAIIIGIILGIVFGVLMLITVFLYRRRQRFREIQKIGWNLFRRRHDNGTTTISSVDDFDNSHHHQHHHHNNIINHQSNCLPGNSPSPIYIRAFTDQRAMPANTEYTPQLLEMRCCPTSPLPPPGLPATGPTTGPCCKCQMPAIQSVRNPPSMIDCGKVCLNCRALQMCVEKDLNTKSSFSPRLGAIVHDGKDNDAVLGNQSMTSNNVNNIFCTVNSRDSLTLMGSHQHHFNHKNHPFRTHSSNIPLELTGNSPEKCPDVVQKESDISLLNIKLSSSTNNNDSA